MLVALLLVVLLQVIASSVQAFLLPQAALIKLIPSKDTQPPPPPAWALPSSHSCRRRVPAAWNSGSDSNTNDNDDGDVSQERAITLHTLELPVLDDPSEYRSLLQARFPGATLLRWHVSEVVERGSGGAKGEAKVALVELVIVERR